MLKKCTEEKEYKHILDNISYQDKCELKAMFGSGWYNKTLSTLEDRNFLILYGYDFENKYVPAAMGGFRTISDKYPKIACVWLLSAKYIYKNKMALTKVLKQQFAQNDKEYQIMCNYIYKYNSTAKSWLKKFGFCFDNPHPKGMKTVENFEFFYKTNNFKY